MSILDLFWTFFVVASLQVSTEMPDPVYKLMALYRQASQRRPSVQYIPMPYRAGGDRGRDNP